MLNFPPHLSRVATLPRISLPSDKNIDDAIDWRQTNSNIPWDFNYWLMCLCRTVTDWTWGHQQAFVTFRVVFAGGRGRGHVLVTEFRDMALSVCADMLRPLDLVPSVTSPTITTLSHSPQYAQFLVCRSLDACQLNLSKFPYQLLNTSLVPTLTWNSFSNFCAGVSFKPIQIFN